MNDTRNLKKYSLLLLVNIAPILIFFCFGELYLRYKGFQPYIRTYPEQYQDEPGVEWVQPHKLMGWTTHPEFLPGEINKQGFRDTKDFSALSERSDKIRVMVLGDSFMFGAGLQHPDTFPSLLQAELADRYQVFNFGVPGWGIDQMYLAYQTYKDLINPDIVILAFIDDDVERTLEAYRIWEKLNKPSFTIDQGQLVSRTPASKLDWWVSQTVGQSVFLSYILREFYLITEAKPIINYVISDINREVSSQGGELLVMRIPTQDQFEPIKLLRRRLINIEETVAGTEATYLDPTQELTQIPNWQTDLYLYDGHLNEFGNQLLIDYIIEHVKD